MSQLRDALDAVVTKSTWRPDNTMLIHDAEAWTTLVGNILIADNKLATPPSAQCTGYAGDPGASAPRCESYEGHPGDHFICPFRATPPASAERGLPSPEELAQVLDRIDAKRDGGAYPHMGDASDRFNLAWSILTELAALRAAEAR